MTVDLWSGRNHKAFMAVTVHYPMPCGELASQLLFFRELAPFHTANNIRMLFEDFMTQFELTAFILVSDNASNMDKAFRTSLFMSEAEESSSSDSVSDEDEDGDGDNSNIEKQSNIPQLNDVFNSSIRCATHTLQLVVHDGIDGIKYDARARSVLAKCKRLARFCSKSVNDAYALAGHIPPRANNTRWSSHFRLMKHILVHAEAIQAALQSSLVVKQINLALTPRDLEVLSEISDLLSYFSEAIDILQAEKVPTINKLIPIIIGIEAALLSYAYVNIRRHVSRPIITFSC